MSCDTSLDSLPSFEEWNECCTDELACFAHELDAVCGDVASKNSIGDDASGEILEARAELFANGAGYADPQTEGHEDCQSPKKAVNTEPESQKVSQRVLISIRLGGISLKHCTSTPTLPPA